MKTLNMHVKTEKYLCYFGVRVMMFNATLYSYILVVSFIGGGNQSTRRKPQTCRNSLTNFITKWCIVFLSKSKTNISNYLYMINIRIKLQVHMYLIYLHFKFFLFMHNIFKLFYKINIDIINWLRQSEVFLVEICYISNSSFFVCG